MGRGANTELLRRLVIAQLTRLDPVDHLGGRSYEAAAAEEE
jgi:hypothetical protein